MKTSNIILLVLSLLITFALSSCGKGDDFYGFTTAEQLGHKDPPTPTPTPDPKDDEDDEDDDDDDLDVVVQSCSNTEHIKKTISISFPDPKVACDWMKDGNLSVKDLYARARREQLESFQMEEKSLICDVSFRFPEQKFIYDDHFFLTYDNVVLASSNHDMVKHLSKIDEMPVYSWDSVVNKELFTTNSPFYLGLGEYSGSGGYMPRTEVSGVMALQVDNLLIKKITALDLNKTLHSFGFVTIGDNNVSDCQHAPISFTVEINYIVLD